MHVLAGTEGHHTGCEDVLIGVDEAFAPLVDGVVVGEVEVGDTVPLQGVEPFGLCAEDELLEDGCLDLRGGALEIAHNELGGTKDGVDAIREQMVDSMLVDHTAHPAVEQDITGKYNI